MVRNLADDGKIHRAVIHTGPSQAWRTACGWHLGAAKARMEMTVMDYELVIPQVTCGSCRRSRMVQAAARMASLDVPTSSDSMSSA